MKIMHLYLKQNMPGREFIHALKKLDDVECIVSWKYQKVTGTRILKKILVVEACELSMLGNIVKGTKDLIDKVVFVGPGYMAGYPNEIPIYEEQEYLDNILDEEVESNEV